MPDRVRVLNTATGQVTDACYPRHRHQESGKFLKRVARAYPDTRLHVICDNYATRKHPDVRSWLAGPDNQSPYEPSRMRSAAIRATAMVGAAVLPATWTGRTEASTTRSPVTPRTRSCGSTTSSASGPMAVAPTAW